jgi:hypothetical protein
MKIELLRRNIEKLLDELQRACAAQEAEQLTQVDQQVRAALQRLVDGPYAAVDKSALLREISGRYQVLSVQAGRSRADISEQLKRMKRDHKAANAYLDASLKG